VQLQNGHLSIATFRAPGQTAIVHDLRTSAQLHVVDGHGKGIEGADVILTGIVIQSPDGNGFFMCQGEFANSVRFESRADGSLRIPSLPANVSVYYMCRFAGCIEKVGSFRTVAEHPSVLEVTLTQGVTLRGRITHLGKAAPGAYVQAVSYSLDDNVLTGHRFGGIADSNGQYSIVAAAGSINITASAPGGGGAGSLFSKPISGVHAAGGTELDGLDVSLVDPITVTGRVLERGTEQPVRDARVDGVFGDTSESKTTGQDGTFTMIVPPCQAQVRVQHIGNHELSYPYPEVNATIDADHNPPLTFYVSHTALLPPISGLEGVVRDSKGQPVTGARIGIVAETMEAHSDALGRFRFAAPINPGSLLYAVSGAAAMSKSLVFLDQHHVSLTLDAKAANCIGTVHDDVGLGRAVAGAEITLYGMRDNFIFPFDHARSDAAGRYSFSGVYPGMPGYALEVKKAGFGREFIDDIKFNPGQSLPIKMIKMARADATISGTVLDPNGRPAAGRMVTCGDASATTDKQGRFHLKNVPRGEDSLSLEGMDNESGSTEAFGGQTDVVIRLQRIAQSPSTAYEDMTAQRAGALVPCEPLNGFSFDTASLKGRIAVIDLWAVWCGPCVRALPEVEALYNKYKGSNVAVIGIHLTGTPIEEAKKLVNQKGLTYPLFMDTNKGANVAVFPAKGVPQLYVVSAAGRIVCDTHDVAEAAAAVEAEIKKR